jgi:hypothetical protein
VDQIPTIENQPQQKLNRRQGEWKSEEIDQLATALSLAQSELEGAKASSTNPFFNSKYADLNAVMEASLPSLSKNGLSVVQGTRFCDITNGFYVSTTLMHKSGQWIKSETRMPIGGKKDAHAIGAAITYGRRYGMAAMVGIAQADDDGNSATDKAPRQSNYKQGVQE